MLIFFSSPSLEQPLYKKYWLYTHKTSPINLFSMSEKKKLIGTRVGGNLSRAVYLAPTQVFDVDFFSSPSLKQP